MPDRIKQTRLEELDVKAKTILQAWQSARGAGSNPIGYGYRQQSDIGDYNSNTPFRKFSNTHHKRSEAVTETYKTGYQNLETRTTIIKPANTGVGPPSLEELWDTEDLEGGPANEAKGGGSADEPVRSAGSRSRFPHKGERTGGALSIKFGDTEAFVPDNTENRMLWENFNRAYSSGGKIGGESALTIFFKLADVAGLTRYGSGTIRELYDSIFGDGNSPSIQATQIFRRNSWSQQDLKVQYDEGREYRYTDSYYRYDVETPDLEFGNADDPQTKQNHQSFTLRRTDSNTIELRKNIHRATARNPGGDQWPNRRDNGTATFNRSDSYDQRFKQRRAKAANLMDYILQQGGYGVSDIEAAWPEFPGISPNKTPQDPGAGPRNLEEIWHGLESIVKESPYSPSAGRSDQTMRLSQYFGAGHHAALDYKIRFLNSLDGTFANVPDIRDVERQGGDGFNAGQVKPYIGNRYIFGDKRRLDIEGKQYTETGSQIDYNIFRSLQKIHNYEQQLIRLKPGGNRINIVFNIKVNLDKLLQQNLLMPTDVHPIDAPGSGRAGGLATQDLATAIEEGEVSNIDDDTFTKLYIKNRSSLHSTESAAQFRRDPPGTIGGVPVSDLQGPVSYQHNTGLGNPMNTNYDVDSHVFEFTEDKQRANSITQDRGFIDNIAGNVLGNSGIAGLLPAVENDNSGDGPFKDRTSVLKSAGRADEQFFPFMFETVNKRGTAHTGSPEYKQYAYFQATLQSLTESYAPAWSSKHFFGRTEQMHTYTFTERSLDLSFVIFATEIRRLQNLYERVNWLAQQTYPSYDASNRLKSGPMIRMSIGDMFSNLSGFIRSLSFDWNYLGAGGKWEITQGLRIPMACTVTMNFTVMHDDMPYRSYNFYPGPMLHPLGISSAKRGTTKAMPHGGPLIPTAARQTAVTQGFTQNSLGRSDYIGKRKEQYIDNLHMNTGKGLVNAETGRMGFVNPEADNDMDFIF